MAYKEELVTPLDAQLQFVLNSFLIPTELTQFKSVATYRAALKGRGSLLTCHYAIECRSVRMNKRK